MSAPFGAQVGYNFDVAGRVTSVTGSGFAGVSTYASNIQYRAWGDQKSVLYNDTSSATTNYDARMHVASYQLTSPTGLKLREQFQYYVDGRFKQMTDLDDRNQDIGFPDTARHFSRTYTYDQSERLTSGTNPSSSTSFPFRQFYAYDEFNNMTSRFSSYYYQTPSSDSSTFQNNRRDGWDYFADGQVKHSPTTNNSTVIGSRDWAYDAAGRMIQAKDTTTANNAISTYLTAYDGDGQSVREYLQEDPNFSGNTYLIRSSVLGEVVTRLDNAGRKVKTVVNVDGLLMAVQTSNNGFADAVSWTHVDPLGLSEAGDTKSVYDPLGNYIRWQNAPTAPPNAYPPSSASFRGLGSAFGTTQDVACTDGGLPINCNTAVRLLNNGSANIDSIISMQMPTNFFAALGMVLIGDVSTSRVQTSPSKPGRPTTPPHLTPYNRDGTPMTDPGDDKEGGRRASHMDVVSISYRLAYVGGGTAEPRTRAAR